jgi:hypothetical protein
LLKSEAKPDVVVRVDTRIVAIERGKAGIAAVVPIAATIRESL